MEEEDINRARKKIKKVKPKVNLVFDVEEEKKKRGRQPIYATKEEAYQAKLAQNREWKKKNKIKGTGIVKIIEDKRIDISKLKIIGGSCVPIHTMPDGTKMTGATHTSKSRVIKSDSESDSESESGSDSDSESSRKSLVGEGITPVARMGGKSKLAARLINWFPDFNTYVELFLGGGNVFLRIPPEKLEGKKIVLNDLDKDMYTIFAGLKKDPKGVNEKVRRKWLTKEEFPIFKNKTDVLSLITRYKNSFYGQGKSWNTKRTAGSKADGFTTDYEKIGNKLKNATITNKSFEKLIPQYDSSTTFFYLDPPYESEKQTDYKDYVTAEQVFNALQGIKGKFMLSYNDSPNIRKVFSKYHIKSVTTEYAGHSNAERRKKNEVVITNYPI
jgi:DNA adenine methylase